MDSENYLLLKHRSSLSYINIDKTFVKCFEVGYQGENKKEILDYINNSYPSLIQLPLAKARGLFIFTLSVE